MEALKSFFTREHPHRLTADQLRKQATFESIDYHKPYPTMYTNHLKYRFNRGRRASSAEDPAYREAQEEEEEKSTEVGQRITAYDSTGRNSSMRWILHVAIGVAVGALASCVSTSVATLEEWRTEQLQSIATSTGSRAAGYFLAMLFWVFTAAVLVFLGTVVVLFVEPAAGGSGIPEVIAFLNGILMPKVLNVRTFVAKALSCIVAVAGGLPVGTEAPLIHLGAIAGAGVTQGRSRTLGCQTGLFHAFRNHKDRRDFVTAGAAAGVSAAFGAPIGGLLFVMEEVASFWDHAASGQIFLGSMISFCTVAFLNTLIESGASGFVSNKAAILFEVNFSIPLNIVAVIPAIFLGIICGLLAVVFTKVNLRVVQLRRAYIKPHFRRKLMEPTAIVIVFALLNFIMALSGSCTPSVPPQPLNVTTGIQAWQTENATKLMTFTCTEEGSYSPLASLTLGMGKPNIRHFFTRRTADEFPAIDVFAFLLIYFTFAMYTSGTFVSSGLVIPMLVIGAATGRLFGIGLVNLFAEQTVNGVSAYHQDKAWMDPGVFAVIGAGAFFGGVSRMTISLSVIMVELSGELHYLLPIMVAITVAKAVADWMSEPLYHALLELDSVPYLPNDVPLEVEQFTAEDVMNPEVVTLGLKEYTPALLHALQTSTHHSFPVVEDLPGGRSRFVGLVTRDDVQLLLAMPALTQVDSETLSAERSEAMRAETSASPMKAPISRADTLPPPPPVVSDPVPQTGNNTAMDDLFGEPVGAPSPTPSTSTAASPAQPEQQQPAVTEASAAAEREESNGSSPVRNSDALRDHETNRAVIAELELSSRARAIAKTTWVEWMRHQTSLFFVIGGTKWHEQWSARNAGGSAPQSPAPTPSSATAGSPLSRYRTAAEVEADAFKLDTTKLPTLVDLSLIVNRSPWVVPKYFNLIQTYSVFRTMGLRHMVVTDGERVVGMISRKDLLLSRLYELLERGRRN